MRKTFILIVVLFHGFSATAVAQETFGFEAGVYGGWAKWRERSFQIGPPRLHPLSRQNSNTTTKSYWEPGSIFFPRVTGLARSRTATKKNTATLSRTSFTPVVLDGGVHHFFYNTVLYPFRYRSARAMPFLTAGIGVAGYKLSDEARARAADPAIYGLGSLKSIDKRFAFNYGGGMKVNVLSHLGVRFDFRHNFSDVPSYGLPKESSNPAQTVLPVQGKLQNFEGSVGIYVHFLK